MTKYISILAFTFYSLNVLAQIPGKTHVFVSVGSQYYLNTKNIVNYSSLATMNAQNTTGHNLGLELERTTKNRFLISAGVCYGYKIHDVQIERDFANFDDEAINNLRTPMKIRHINNRQSYVHTRLMVGYKLPVNNKYSIVAKGGITAHSFTKSIYPDVSTYVGKNYYTDDFATLRQTTVMSVNDRLIDNLEIPGIRKMNYSIFGYCLYLGIERTISSKYVKLVNFGIEATKRRKTDSENYLIRTKSNEKWNSIGQELVSDYLDRNISLGLRLAVGLWR